MDDNVIFACPRCTMDLDGDDLVDRKYSLNRVQSTDDILHNDKDGINKLKELWYCWDCDSYFLAEYHLSKIVLLEQSC